jgi:hypothetical protein
MDFIERMFSCGARRRHGRPTREATAENRHPHAGRGDWRAALVDYHCYEIKPTGLLNVPTYKIQQGPQAEANLTQTHGEKF